MKWKNKIVGHDEVAPDQLLAHPLNWRLHPQYQQETLADTINEIGFIKSVTVNKTTGRVIDGHLRVTLAMRNEEETIPVEYVELTESEESEALLTLDPIAELAGADRENLTELQESIEVESENIDRLIKELYKKSKLQGTPHEPDAEIDKAEELRVKWNTELGQLWQIGNHRLLCGDSTNSEDVGRVLDGDVPNLMVTDPPYGVNYDPNWRNKLAAEGKLVYSDGTPGYAASRIGKVVNDDRADWGGTFTLFPGDVIYAWTAQGALSITSGMAIQDAGYEIRSQLIWVKPHFPISRGHYTYQHEPLWYAVKKGRQAHWIGEKNASSKWEITLDKNVDGGHSTQKPLECMERPIRHHSGDVYEPFAGSGTTLVASQNQQRRCYAIEIDPGYVGVILERMSNMGLTPVLVDK